MKGTRLTAFGKLVDGKRMGGDFDEFLDPHSGFVQCVD